MSAQDFWDAAAPWIAVTEKHPFLVAMVDGTLAKENFQYYVIQDALYLNDFADCLRRLSQGCAGSGSGSGISGSSNDDNDAADAAAAKRLEDFAKGAEQAELSLHKSFFVDWQISAEGVEQMPNCLLYTSYMKRVVATECHAHGLAVLLPCFWVYMHVGQCMLKLRDELGDSVTRPPEFDAWIDMYGGEEFEKEVKDYIAMVNVACQSASPESLEIMKRHFIMSCKLEHMFWDQASERMTWPDILGTTGGGGGGAP